MTGNGKNYINNAYKVKVIMNTGMNKKTIKTKKTRIIKELTLMDKLPKNHGEWLMLCINLTQRAIDRSDDTGLKGQIGRLKVQLDLWNSLNPK